MSFDLFYNGKGSELILTKRKTKYRWQIKVASGYNTGVETSPNFHGCVTLPVKMLLLLKCHKVFINVQCSVNTMVTIQ